MPTEYVDKGLATLIAQWKQRYPRAVVGTRGDRFHKPPSHHLPEEDGSIDAGDFMAGNGVTQDDLDDLAETLRRNRDRRIAYVIRRDKIFSSTIEPWEWRDFTGEYHGHTHVSVNDLYENNTRPWAGIGVPPAPDPKEAPLIRIKAKDASARYLSNGAHIPSMKVDEVLEKAGVPLVEVATTKEALALLPPPANAPEIDYPKFVAELLRQAAAS